jgi:hypothetical protein
MNLEKSNLKLQQFNQIEEEFKTITRFTSLENVLDFILNKQLHFSPFSSFPDYTEGRSLRQATCCENDNELKQQETPPYLRRDFLYASCWHIGEENLYMWDIYGKDKNNCLAIQLNIDNLIKDVFTPGNFWFSSEKFEQGFDKKMPSPERFKISCFHFGKLDYVDLEENSKNKKLYIGRFKDKAFSHENELRFLLRQNYKNLRPVCLRDLKCKFLNNAEEKLNIKILVNPYAQKSYFDFIKKAFYENKNVEVIHSKFKQLFQ